MISLSRSPLKLLPKSSRIGISSSCRLACHRRLLLPRCHDRNSTSKALQHSSMNERLSNYRTCKDIHFFSTLPKNDAADYSEQSTRTEKDLSSYIEMFSTMEYQNVWSTTSTIPTNIKNASSHPPPPPPLLMDFSHPQNKIIDRQSRFLLQLLQTMYTVGLTKTIDRITTERCNTMIQRLMAIPANNSNNQRNKNANDDNNLQVLEDTDGNIVDEQDVNATSSHSHNDNEASSSSYTSNSSNMEYFLKAERARAILECMELFQPLQYNEINQRHKFPVPLPVPNHETYFYVLKMYASKELWNNIDLSNQTRIDLFNQTPIIAKHVVEKMKSTNQLALQPSCIHWNQVLCTYGYSLRPERPLEAATLLYSLDVQNVTDESSFSHVLRCCIPTTMTAVAKDEKTNQQRYKFAKIGVAVAQRVWKGLKQHHVDKTMNEEDTSTSTLEDILLSDTTTQSNIITNNKRSIHFKSHHFVYMLRVARNFLSLYYDNNNSNNKQNPIMHRKWIENIFMECCTYGKVNVFIIQELTYQVGIIYNNSNNTNTNTISNNKEQHTTIHTLTNQELEWIENLIINIMEKQPSSLTSSTNNNKQSLLNWFDSLKQKRNFVPARASGRVSKQIIQQLPTTWTSNAD